MSVRQELLTPMRKRGAMAKRKSATAMHGGQARARQIWREVLKKRRFRKRHL